MSKRYVQRSNCGVYTLLVTDLLGFPPAGMVVDHIDHSTLNNQKSNLRFVTQAQNHQNQKTRGKVSYLGVSDTSGKTKSSFKAQIKKNNVLYCLGTYRTPEEAAHAYDNKATELYGDEATLNFSRGGKHLLATSVTQNTAMAMVTATAKRQESFTL